MADKMKVLVYWTLENNWSIVSTAAVRGESMPGARTFAKFQGKWYPAIPIAKSDNQKALHREETSFREFINITLAEEDPDDIEDKILEYVNAKDSVADNIDMRQDNSRKQARITKPKDITDKALQQKSALETGQKLLEKCSQQKVSTPDRHQKVSTPDCHQKVSTPDPVHSSESDDSETDSQATYSQGENVDVTNSQVKDDDVRSPQKVSSTSTPDEVLIMSPFKKLKTDIPETSTSGVQFVTFDQLEDVLERYVKSQSSEDFGRDLTVRSLPTKLKKKWKKL